MGGNTSPPSQQQQQGDDDTSEAPPQTFIESLGLSVAQLESLTRGDFVYCERAGDDLDSNAYQLRLVNHRDASGADYCTVSQAGVTHVRSAVACVDVVSALLHAPRPLHPSQAVHGRRL